MKNDLIMEKYLGHSISADKQGIKWTACIREKGTVSWIEIPGTYDSEKLALETAREFLKDCVIAKDCVVPTKTFKLTPKEIKLIKTALEMQATNLLGLLGFNKDAAKRSEEMHELSKRFEE